MYTEFNLRFVLKSITHCRSVSKFYFILVVYESFLLFHSEESREEIANAKPIDTTVHYSSQKWCVLLSLVAQQ